MFYKPALQWASIALAVRLLLGLMIHIYSLHAGFNGFVPMSSAGDDTFYWELANQLFLGYSTDALVNAYPLLLAALFKITGPSILAAKLFNLVLNIISVYLTILITKEIGQAAGLANRTIKIAGNMTGALLAFYPSQIFYAVQMLKDPFLVFAGTMNLYSAILLFRGKGNKFWNGIGWGMSMIGVCLFRPYTLIALITSWLLYLLFVWKVNLSRKVIVVIVLLVLIGCLPYFAGLGFFASNYIGPWLDLEKVSGFRSDVYSAGSSAADISLDYSTPIAFLQTYGFSTLTAMFGPFPWQVKSIVQIIALPEALFTLFLSVVLLFPARRLRSRHSSSIKGKSSPYILLIFSIVLIGLIGLFSDNIGGNTRLRILSWNIFFAFSSIVLAERYFPGHASGKTNLVLAKKQSNF